MAESLKKQFLNTPNYITMGRLLAVPIMIVMMGYMDDRDLSKLRLNVALSYGCAGLFFLAMMSDIVDGYLARKHKIISVFGQFFDPLADKLLFLVAMIFMVELGRIPAWIVCIFLAREVIVTTLRGVAIDNGIVIPASHWGKYKSAFVSTTSVGLLIHYPLWGIEWRMMAWVFIWPSLLFSFGSGIHYTVGFVRELRKRNRLSSK